MSGRATPSCVMGLPWNPNAANAECASGAKYTPAATGSTALRSRRALSWKSVVIMASSISLFMLADATRGRRHTKRMKASGADYRHSTASMDCVRSCESEHVPPPSLPPRANASGVIVSASMVRIAPCREVTNNLTVSGEESEVRNGRLSDGEAHPPGMCERASRAQAPARRLAISPARSPRHATTCRKRTGAGCRGAG
jgi:hypothetical protein